jgi:glycosyltransferase involved in cell wall biosynthesis
VIRVGINARALAKPDPAGVSRYTRSLVEALTERATRDGDFEFVLFGLDTLPETVAEYDCVRNAGEPAAAHSGLRAHGWEQLALPRALGDHDLDVFHTPAGQPPLFTRLSGASGPALVTTIHDVSQITHPEWFSCGYAALYRTLTPLAVRASDRILTVSAFARQEIATTYPSAASKTTVVHNGVTPPAEPGSSVDGLHTGEFLLSVGAVNGRKNVRTLLRVYRRYRARTRDPISLALAGPERDVFAEREYELPVGVRTLGYVSDAELGWLYRNAAAFVFPSLYEGFGLPILEAMHAGTPVVTSDRGAMAEVAGDAAVLVNPLDVEALADGTERVLADEAYRNRLVARGHERAASFTWERAAARVAAVYRAAASGADRETADRGSVRPTDTPVLDRYS